MSIEANKLASIRRIVELCRLDRKKATTALRHVALGQQALIEIEQVLDADEEAPTEAYAIEFRSGSFFESDASERGVTAAAALKFATAKEAEQFIDHHSRRDWIRMHGGMVKRVTS